MEKVRKNLEKLSCKRMLFSLGNGGGGETIIYQSIYCLKK